LAVLSFVEGTIEHQPHIRFSTEIPDMCKGTVCSRNVQASEQKFRLRLSIVTLATAVDAGGQTLVVHFGVQVV
jgi:hypothetical protein